MRALSLAFFSICVLGFACANSKTSASKQHHDITFNFGNDGYNSRYSSSSRPQIRGCEKYYWGSWSSGCEICSRGYYQTKGFLNSYSCDQCALGCDTCSNNRECQVCSAGHFMVSPGACGNCLNGCGTCIEGHKCLRCKVGYFLKEDQTCELCTSGCDVCSNMLTCDTCSNAFFKNVEQKCSACHRGCERCQNEAQCSQCNPDFNLVEQKCVEKSWLAKNWIHLVLWPVVALLICICCCADCIKHTSSTTRTGNQITTPLNPVAPAN